MTGTWNCKDVDGETVDNILVSQDKCTGTAAIKKIMWFGNFSFTVTGSKITYSEHIHSEKVNELLSAISHGKITDLEGLTADVNPEVTEVTSELKIVTCQKFEGKKIWALY